MILQELYFNWKDPHFSSYIQGQVPQSIDPLGYFSCVIQSCLKDDNVNARVEETSLW